MSGYAIGHKRIKIILEEKQSSGYVKIAGVSKRVKWRRKTIAKIDIDDTKYQQIIKILEE